MGGVFINYRTVDDPLGAASIHGRLAQQFGMDNVFRDCDSLTPGDHYPSSIRTALESAAVVVAVIGPQWLTLTDGDAVRLIDREHDWVREELADAFQLGIPVLPVLLKDTPANATMPPVTALPESIRKLAGIQAMPVSQLRLIDDLERLTAQVARIVPSPRKPTSPQTVFHDVFFAMVDAMEEVPSLTTEYDRASLINRLPRSIAGNVSYSARRRTHMVNILNACRAYPDGVFALLEQLVRLDGRDCVPVRVLIELAAKLPPV